MEALYMCIYKIYIIYELYILYIYIYIVGQIRRDEGLGKHPNFDTTKARRLFSRYPANLLLWRMKRVMSLRWLLLAELLRNHGER